MAAFGEDVEAFLLGMREFGLFEDVERHLPAEFSAVYEIARVLHDPEHPLWHRFAPLLNLFHTHDPQQQEASAALPRQYSSEEYDAELIRHYRDVVRIYPHQFLLPEEVFYHRLAERTLWMPVPRPPRVYGYQTHGDVYAPDIRKQKVYILFDTSASMQQHHRIQLAKAIAYTFLRRNQAELGEVFLRTFDLHIGELHHAFDQLSFERLLRTVLRLQAVGQGTMLEQAIMTAIEDIRRKPSLVQSEILLFTDGIAYLHVGRIRELLGDDIRLHAVRLGAGPLHLQAKAVEDFAYRDDGEASRQFRRLQDEKHHIERQLAHVSGEHQRRLLQNQLHSLEQQCSLILRQLERQAQNHYATALRELCTVYVAVEDVPLEQLVQLSAERRRSLEQAAQELIHRLREAPTSEDFQTAALLSEYMSFLAQCCSEASSLRELAQQLRRLISEAVQQRGYRAASQEVRMSRVERRILMQLVAIPGLSFRQLLRFLSLHYWFRRLRLWLRRLGWQWRLRHLQRYK